MFLKRKADDSSDSETKRIALQSESSTPVKGNRNDNDQKSSQESTSLSKTPTAAIPSKAGLTSPTTSPLVNIETMIRKKISSGAYALHENIGHSWFKALQIEFDKPYFKKLSEFVREQRKSNIVYPPENKVYSWTHHHDIRGTRVVVIGQDPYHGPGQAHGLSFSVQRGTRIPPSLVNIYKELEQDIKDFRTPNHGHLVGWAKQGVLLLNTCLTVTQGKPNSHQGKGWENFTDSVITWISRNTKHQVVFLLWGNSAQKKSTLIASRHKILKAAHPSPLSAHTGFNGCRHFSQANAFLRSQSLPEIDWKDL